MDILKILAKIFLYISFFTVSSSAFVINEVIIKCEGSVRCAEVSKKFLNIKNKEINAASLKAEMSYLLFDESIKTLSYTLERENGAKSLFVEIGIRNIVQNVKIVSNSELDTVPLIKQLKIKSGDYFDDQKVKDSETLIRSYFKDQGYPSISINRKWQKNELMTDLTYLIDVGNPVIVKDIIFEFVDNQNIEFDVTGRLLKMKKKIWNNLRYKYQVDLISKELFSLGFFFSRVKSYEPVFIDEGNGVVLKIKISPGKRYSFSFVGNSIFNHQELISKIREQTRISFGEFSKRDVINIIKKSYEDRGLFYSKVNVSIREGKDRNGHIYQNYFTTIEEGVKVPLINLNFVGNASFSINKIKTIYYENSSVLADRDFLDLKYLKKFRTILKETYLKNGYIFINISKPIVNFDKMRKVASVEFKIKERQKSNLKEIKLLNVPLELQRLIKNELVNKEGNAFNVISLEKDLGRIIDVVREQGYYYATINNINKKTLIQYGANFNNVILNIGLALGKITIFDSVLVTGHKKTSISVIEREVPLKKGDILTPDVVKKINLRLGNLGIFSYVRISPFVRASSYSTDKYLVNLLVQVQEKDFGVGEFAPGYRTDIGMKASVGVSYNNLWGLNHGAAVKLQANQRLNFDNLDVKRRAKEKRLIEFSADVKYSWPYVFSKYLKTKLDLDLTTSVKRRRFFGFDADIFKISPRFVKNWGDSVTTTLKYQFETIKQFDATKLEENDSFRIGGLTPGITIDMRDNPLTPRRGGYFSLSWEFANPFFASMDEHNLKINFSKVVSRNRLYLPVSKNGVLALSMSAGYQKNYATELVKNESGELVTQGFIPSIKVFRLDGVDTVRGYEDNEINILEDGRDIADVEIRDKAFFTTIKIEPRLYMSDSLALGVFFDAGRVFVNKFKPLDLRTSGGASLKVLTPVGSLNFDYGVKLKRKSLDDGNRESFGKFHLSIGFF